MAYSKIQLIAYEIGTMPKVVHNPDGSTSQVYAGIPKYDAQARCALMQRALTTAVQNLPQTTPPEPPGTTLKVLLAPEFFFRGPKGAYSMDEVQQIVTLLQDQSAEDTFADWVFGFGTILGVAEGVGSCPPGKEVYNFTLIQRGGPANRGHLGARVVMKELKSQIDFIATSVDADTLVDAQVTYPTPGASGPGGEQLQVNYDGAGIFALADITWAVEICLDHLNAVHRRLKSPQLPGASQVQVQLVPAGGMSIQESSIIAAQGGFVFCVDGRAAGQSFLHRVAARNVDIVAQTSINVDGSNIDVPGASPPLSSSVTDLFPQGPGRIRFYPEQPIPEASTVQGTVRTLKWPASAHYQFQFDLIYDAAGDFKAVLCQPISTKTDFHARNYFLPLVLSTSSADALRITQAQPPDVNLAIYLLGPAEAYSHAVWCRIGVPGFDFEGILFLFDSRMDGKEPRTIW